jgi:hypothetical protein
LVKQDHGHEAPEGVALIVDLVGWNTSVNEVEVVELDRTKLGESEGLSDAPSFIRLDAIKILVDFAATN